MGVHVGVAGASGYAGGELLRLLAGHPSVTLGPVTAGSHAGEPVTAVHPHLPQFSDRIFEPTDPSRLARADLVFLALPHGQSAAVAADLPGTVKVVDLGADHRLADPACWQDFYGTGRPDGQDGAGGAGLPDRGSMPGGHGGRWVCGLPELPGARARIAAATRIAVPGCFATAAILALTPLTGAGLVASADIVIVAASGTSGAGRVPQARLLGTEVMGSVSAYQAGGVHRHIPEIEQALREALAQPAGAAPVSVCFTPMLAPMPRGILATCTARLTAAATSAGGPEAVAARLRAALADAYAGEPFVHVLGAGRWPATAATTGSNAAHLQAAADLRTGRAVVVAAIDNLGKGAAGQAVQNANLMLGLPETAGLTADGVAP